MPKGLAPLMIVTWHGDAAAVRWLLARGAAVDAPYPTISPTRPQR